MFFCSCVWSVVAIDSFFLHIKSLVGLFLLVFFSYRWYTRDIHIEAMKWRKKKKWTKIEGVSSKEKNGWASGPQWGGWEVRRTAHAPPRCVCVCVSSALTHSKSKSNDTLPPLTQLNLIASRGRPLSHPPWWTLILVITIQTQYLFLLCLLKTDQRSDQEKVFSDMSSALKWPWSSVISDGLDTVHAVSINAWICHHLQLWWMIPTKLSWIL